MAIDQNLNLIRCSYGICEVKSRPIWEEKRWNCEHYLLWLSFFSDGFSNLGLILRCPASTGRGGENECYFQALCERKKPPLSSRSWRVSHSSTAQNGCYHLARSFCPYRREYGCVRLPENSWGRVIYRFKGVSRFISGLVFCHLWYSRVFLYRFVTTWRNFSCEVHFWHTRLCSLPRGIEIFY